MASENGGESNVRNEMKDKEQDEIVLPSPKGSLGIIKDPNFAVVCSFIQIFGPLLHFKELSIETLQQFFDNPSQDNQEDIQALFIKLLRKAGCRVIPEKWEKGLLKFVKEFDDTIAWDLQQFGFKELLGTAKLAILKHLLESQFDYNEKFKTAVNCELTPVDLRALPVGSDIDGLIYWFHEDELLQIRLYSTEEDELDCEAWKVLACDVEEIMDVVKYLEIKSQTNPKDVAVEKRNEKRKQNTYKIQKKKKTKKDTKTNGKIINKKEKLKSCDTESESNESDLDDDNPCARCYSGVHPEWILLCDQCDAAYHTACLRPPLMSVPIGDWFCPYCKTVMLMNTLKEIYTRISTRIKARSRAISRKNASGINLSNIRQSGRVRKTVDYTFSDFDQEISDAVEVNGRNKRGDEKPQVTVPEVVRGIRQSKRRRMLYRDSDSDSNYDPGSPMVEQRIHKHPERHVYLRRHGDLMTAENSHDVSDKKNDSEDSKNILETDKTTEDTLYSIDSSDSTPVIGCLNHSETTAVSNANYTEETEITIKNSCTSEDNANISVDETCYVNGKVLENGDKIGDKEENHVMLNCQDFELIKKENDLQVKSMGNDSESLSLTLV